MANGNTVDQDIQRIERMFSRVIWLVGLLWGTGLIGILGTFFVGYKLFYDVADSLERKVTTISSAAESRITEISRSAENRIQEASLRAIDELTNKIMSKIDVDEMVTRIEKQHVGLIQERMNAKILIIEDSVNSRTNIIKEDLETYKNKIDSIADRYRLVLQSQQALEKMQIQIDSLDATPYTLERGKPAQLQIKLSTLGLEKSSRLQLRIEFNLMENPWTHEAEISGSDSPYFSGGFEFTQPITIPSQGKNASELGPGEYSLIAQVFSQDRQIFFAQKSRKLTIR
jgi:hypothetical protein